VKCGVLEPASPSAMMFGYGRGHPWSDTELQELKSLIDAGRTVPEIARVLDRTQEGVRRRAAMEGWYASPSFSTAHYRDWATPMRGGRSERHGPQNRWTTAHDQQPDPILTRNNWHGAKA
jgi:hypothetical protein